MSHTVSWQFIPYGTYDLLRDHIVFKGYESVNRPWSSHTPRNPTAA